MSRFAALFLAIALLPFAQSAQAQSEPIQVMILGTYPFAIPGLASAQDDAADILSPANQAQIAETVDALARFRPTAVAVEVEPERSERIDSLYDLFRQNHGPLAPDEIQQIGFRVADRMDLDELAAIDHDGEFPMAEVMSFAQRYNPALATYVLQRTSAMTAAQNEKRESSTVGEMLRFMNEPAQIQAAHQLYVSMAGLGAGANYVGADLLSAWYDRNIRIFANLQNLAERGDRVLVIFGAGHSAILRELVAADPSMELVEPGDFLPS